MLVKLPKIPRMLRMLKAESNDVLASVFGRILVWHRMIDDGRSNC